MLGVYVVSFLLGVVLVGWAVLPYELEERHAEDVLVAWWVAADDAASSPRLREATLAVVAWLGNLFGERLLSRTSFAVSVCLSLSSALLFFGLALLTIPFVISGSASCVTPLVVLIGLISLLFSGGSFRAAIASGDHAAPHEVVRLVGTIAALQAVGVVVVANLRDKAAVPVLTILFGIAVVLILGAFMTFTLVAVSRRLYAWGVGAKRSRSRNILRDGWCAGIVRAVHPDQPDAEDSERREPIHAFGNCWRFKYFHGCCWRCGVCGRFYAAVEPCVLACGRTDTVCNASLRDSPS